MDPKALLLQVAPEEPGKLPVLLGQDLGQGLEDRHPAPKPGEGLGELKPDGPTPTTRRLSGRAGAERASG